MTRSLSSYLLISGVFLTLFISCEKGEDPPPPVTDIEGNIYQTVRIGNQVWMAENLKTTRYNDSTEILLITKSHDWNRADFPGFCWYNNDSSMFKNPYGALYNGYAAENEKICPAGWHIPDSDEWRELVNFLEDTVAGGKLKVDGITQWYPPNEGADNSSGFTALPAGIRYFEGTFSSHSYFTAFWSATERDASGKEYISLSYLDSKATFSSKSKKSGFSIRCIRD